MPQQLRPKYLDGSQRQALGTSQAAKPLPRLPRGWSRVCHETGLFLRSIGLGIFVTAFQGFFTHNFLEPEKVAIRQSRVTSLLRALIHLLPLGLAIFEITLNWKGHYVGRLFDKQNYLQFAAKTHEIFMQASIATLVLSYIRYQISTGKGMPFGAVLGALQFFQVSYLWSVELWSAVISKDFQLRKKICFTFLITICITVAATAGPSSANLLIARQGIWPMNSNYLAVNATFQEIWPNQFGDEKARSNCRKVRTDDRTALVSCPIFQIYDSFLKGAFQKAASGFAAHDMLLRFKGMAAGGDPTAARSGMVSFCFGNFDNQFCSTIPQNALLLGLLEKVGDLDRGQFGRALQGYVRVRENYYQPYTAASCITDTVQNSFDQTPLQFVRLLETASELERSQEKFPVPSLTKGQFISKIPENSSGLILDWVNLPQETFRTGVPGAIIVHPQSSNDLFYNITTCTLNAGWGSSSIFTYSGDLATVSSHVTQMPPGFEYKELILDAFGYARIDRPLFTKISNFTYPQVPINISKVWMESLNPTLIAPDNSTTNLLSNLFLDNDQPDAREVAIVLNVILATALSNTGMEHHAKGSVFENRTQASKLCENCLVFEMENSIYGWQYSTQETTTKLAIAVMVTYCVLALAHLLYSAISGVSSTAWDSTAELVALAMNSSPTEALHNTCAGIIGKRAYQTNVRVMKTSEKHLELVFGEVKDPNADITKLVMDEKYGGIVGQEGTEDEEEPSMLEGQGEMRKRAWFKHD